MYLASYSFYSGGSVCRNISWVGWAMCNESEMKASESLVEWHKSNWVSRGKKFLEVYWLRQATIWVQGVSAVSSHKSGETKSWMA
jgi:hypothetical protein